MAGRMSVYRGPLLLAYDVLLNDNAPPEPAPCTPSDLQKARISFPSPAPDQARIGRFAPWLIVDVPRADGTVLRLCDFASAGARGSHYVSWLPADQIAPPAPQPDAPAETAAVPPGRLLFRARRPTAVSNEQRLRLLIADNPELHKPIIEMPCEQPRSIVVPEEQSRQLKPNVAYYWRLSAENPWGTTLSSGTARQFTIDPSLTPLQDDMLTEYGENADGVVVQAALQGNADPSYGTLGSAAGWKSAPGPDGTADQAVELNGTDGMLVYQLRAFPQSEYTVALRFSAQRVAGPLGQVLSAWCRNVDDPLRICVLEGKLYVRIEAGGGYSTTGVPIQQDTWYDVCIVKRSSDLTLFVDGKPVETIRVPAAIASAAQDFALGGNPHFTGNSEQLPCRVAGLELNTRPLTPDEVATRFATRAQ
jgi:hypothetical protein